MTVVNGEVSHDPSSDNETDLSDTGSNPSADTSMAVLQILVRAISRKAVVQVSFKYLSLVSSFFEYMLEGKYTEMLAA
jgi:hypothetical protein